MPSERNFSQKLMVRGFHTFLVVAVPASFLWAHTGLNIQALIDSGFDLAEVAYRVAYGCLWFSSLVLYYVTCCTNPGYVETKSRPNYEGESSDEGSGEEGSEGGLIGIQLRKCGYCDIYQPVRARHCEDCGRCVRRFDHHCPWLGVCVGERNHALFWSFLLSTTLLIWWSLFVAVHNTGLLGGCGKECWIKYNIVLLLDVIVCGFSGLAVSGLLIFHTYLALTNQTTWEVASRRRITYLKYLGQDENPFNAGYFRNCRQFLCSCSSLTVWENLYTGHQRSQSNGVV